MVEVAHDDELSTGHGQADVQHLLGLRLAAEPVHGQYDAAALKALEAADAAVADVLLREEVIQ